MWVKLCRFNVGVGSHFHQSVTDREQLAVFIAASRTADRHLAPWCKIIVVIFKWFWCTTATAVGLLLHFFGKSIAVLMIYKHTSVFVVVGREEGPFSAPKALEAPMGELGPEPGALLVGVESTEHQGVRNRMHAHTLHTHRLGITAAASQQFNVYSHGCLITMVFFAWKCNDHNICSAKWLIVMQLCNNNTNL